MSQDTETRSFTLTAADRIGRAFVFLSAASQARLALASPVACRLDTPLGCGRLQPLGLASLTSDKELYAPGTPVNLLLLAPLHAGTTAALTLTRNHDSEEQVPAAVNRHGAALVTLSGLLVGHYAAVSAVGDQKATCEFTVAEYELAALEGELSDKQRLPADRLRVTLAVRSFGRPLTDVVRLQLVQEERVESTLFVQAREGVAVAEFALKSPGPYSIRITSKRFKDRIATVPIVGSAANQRCPTAFSRLGAWVTGALLPGAAGTPAVRGLYFEPDGAWPEALELESVTCRRARLRATADLEHLCLVAVDPSRWEGGTRPATAAIGARLELQHVRQGQVVELDVPSPLGLLLAGAQLRGQPWEAWAVTVAPPSFAVHLEVPEALEPHAELPVTVTLTPDHGQPATADASVFLLVKDHRLQTAHTPASKLATGLKEWTKSWDDGLATRLGTPPGVPRLLIVDECAFWGEFLLAPARVTLGNGATCDVDFQRGWPTGELAAVERQADGGFVLCRLAPLPVEIRVNGACVKDRCRLQDRDIISVGYARLFFDATGTLATTRLPRTRLRWLNDEAQGVPGPDVSSPASPADAEWLSLESVESLEACAAAPPHGTRGTMRRSVKMTGGSAVAAKRLSAGTALAASHGAVYDILPERAENEVASGAVFSVRQAVGPEPQAVEHLDVLFCGLLDVRNGKAEISVRLGAAVGTCVVEAFAIAGAEWATAEKTFAVVRDPLAALELPAFMGPKDRVPGRLHAEASSGHLELRLWRNGQPLAFATTPATPGTPVPAEAGTATLRGCTTIDAQFTATPGDYRAEVLDVTRNRRHSASHRIGLPGCIRREVMPLRFLLAGESLALDQDTSLREITLMPGLMPALRGLLVATTEYPHLCCEQTAARLLAAALQLLYLPADDVAGRTRSERAVTGGIERLRTMWLPQRGFKLYPDSPDTPSRTWGERAAEHLQFLRLLQGSDRVSAALHGPLTDGLRMGDDALTAYGREWPPRHPRQARDAYLALRFDGDREAALALVQRLAAKMTPAPAAGEDWVAWRTESAFLAAAMLRTGIWTPDAWRLVNAVCAALDGGRLYATADSMAAVALFAELQAAGLASYATCPVVVNGQETTLATALARQEREPVRTVTGRAPVTLVQVRRDVEEAWQRFAGKVHLDWCFRKASRPPGALFAETSLGISLGNGDSGRRLRRLVEGMSVDLEVALTNGYEDGDLLWVCLPPCLSRLQGGGMVKLFSVDFAGRPRLRIPLVATAPTYTPDGRHAPQHFSLCLRNMFVEERGGSPGLLAVSVRPFRPVRNRLLRWLYGG